MIFSTRFLIPRTDRVAHGLMYLKKIQTRGGGEIYVKTYDKPTDRRLENTDLNPRWLRYIRW